MVEIGDLSGEKVFPETVFRKDDVSQKMLAHVPMSLIALAGLSKSQVPVSGRGHCSLHL